MKKKKNRKGSEKLRKKVRKVEESEASKLEKHFKKYQKRMLAAAKKRPKSENESKREMNRIEKESKKEMKKVKGDKKDGKGTEEETGIKKKRVEISKGKKTLYSLLISVIFGIGTYYFFSGVVKGLIVFGVVLALINVYFIVAKRMKHYANIKKMEDAFPDFISLMSSNLRAGMTVDRALLLSSREEFAPLDAEILHLGKDIVTGREISSALEEMGKRIKSDKITKTILLINSGIKSGGNLSVLLEETALNMRERQFVEKKAASNVLMYVIFVFFAVAIGAPLLFGLSSVLVDVLTGILGSLPEQQATTGSLPFTFSEVNISSDFVIYFSLIFVIMTDILASFVLGLVSTGHERDGAKYIVPLIVIGIAMFFGARLILSGYFAGAFGT